MIDKKDAYPDYMPDRCPKCETDLNDEDVHWGIENKTGERFLVCPSCDFEILK